MNSYFVVFETTSDCDNDCIYCYNVWKDTYKKYPPEDCKVKKEDILEKILQKIAPTGICFTGGEPLLSPGIFDLLKYCRPKVKFLSLATNGKNLSEKFFSLVSPKMLDLIDISIPSLRESGYREICKSEGAEKVKYNITLSKNRGFRVNVSFTAMKINKDEIPDLLDFAFALSADSATINFFSPAGRGALIGERLVLTPDEKLQIIKIADEFSEKYGYPVIFGIPFERCRRDISPYKNIKMSSCLCGEVKFAVDFNGNIRPCEMSDLVLGNILSDDFTTVVKSEELKKFRSNNYSPDCTSCGSFNKCMGSCRFSV